MATMSTEQPLVTEELLRKMASVTGPCITIVLQAGAPADFERAKKHAIDDVRKQLTNGYSGAAPLLKAIEKVCAGEVWVERAMLTGLLSELVHLPVPGVLVCPG